MKAIKPALIALCLTTLTGAVAVGCSHKHTFGDWTVEKEATCTEEGLRVRECECGEKEEEAIPTIAHTFAWAYDAVEHWKACTVCGTEEENSREYHTPIMGTCMDLCGFTMNPIEAMGLEIEEIEVNGEKTGESRVKGIGICKDYTSITIPAYDIATGNPIVEIGDRAFNGDYNHASESGEESSPLEHVEIPRTIRKIGNYAFAHNPKLKELTIPDSVTEIGMNAFQALPFEHFEIPRGITKISNAMFADCDKLKELEIPSNITQIDGFAFLGCTALIKVTIPTSVKVVGPYAFDCDSTGYNELEESDEAYDIPASLAQVIYLGTLNEWCEIQFGMDKGEKYGFNSDKATPLGATDFVKLYVDGQPITSVSFANGLEEIGASFRGYASLTSVTFPSSLRKISKEAFKDCVNLSEVSFAEGLEEIGEDAFEYSGLTSVTLPASLSVLGEHVFYKCPDLETVEIKGGALTAIAGTVTGMFEECTALTSVTIGEGIQEIGTAAFYKCSALNTVTLPASLKKIGENAFRNAALTQVVIPAGVEEISENAFRGLPLSSVTFNASAVKIDDFAFAANASLGSVDLSHATYLGKGAFASCTSLTTVSLPTGAFYLAGDAFDDCPITYTTEGDYKYLGNWLVEVVNKEITTIQIKQGVIGIAEGAFSELENVSGRLDLPSSLVYIGKGAFFGLANLTGDLIIPPSVRSIGAAAFAGTEFTKLVFGGNSTNNPSQLETIEDAPFNTAGAFEGCLFETVTLPDSLTHLGAGAFKGCTNLRSVTFGTAGKLKTIGGISNGGVFQGCTGLIRMELPEGVETIGGHLFEDCTNLQQVVIPDSVKTLDDYAFEGCTSLTKVTLPGLEIIYRNTFDGCSQLMEIEYHGTSEQWDNAVANSPIWDTSLPQDRQVRCTK